MPGYMYNIKSVVRVRHTVVFLAIALSKGVHCNYFGILK